MNETDRKTIKYLFASFLGCYGLIILLGSFVFIGYEPQFGNQLNSTSTAVIIAASGGLNNFDFHNESSKNLGIVFQIIGIIAWAHFCPIILIYWNSKANELPDASYGFDPKK